MDISLNISFSQALFTSIIILFLFHKLRNWFQTKSSTPKLPPGPRKLPIIGNIHNLAGAMPHHRLAELANTYGPLMHLKLGEKSMVVISSAEAAKQIMKVHDVNFASRPYTLAGEIFVYNFKDIAQAPYGEYWRQARKIFSLELLSSRRVQSFRALREATAAKMVAEIGANAEAEMAVNLSDMLFMFSHRIISGAAFGKKDKYGIRFKEIIRKLVELSGGFSVADIFPSVKFLQVISGVRPGLEKLRKEADEVLEDMLREHRAAKARRRTNEEEEDLVDVLLDLQEHSSNEFQLTDDSIKGLLEIFHKILENIAQAPYGEYWRQARKIFSLELLSSRRVQSFRALREATAAKMVAEIGANAEAEMAVNLSNMLFMFSHRIISGAAFGKKDKYGIRFKEIIRKLVELSGGFSVADIFPSVKFLQVISGVRPGLEKLRKEADEVLEDMLREHRAAEARRRTNEEEEDLVDVLLDLQEHSSNEFQLTDDSIKGLLEDCFLGGIETGSSTIEWIISEMLRNPRVLRKAQAEVRELHARTGGLEETDLHELTYMNQVIRENFRMHPPLPLLLPRESAENRVIFGHDIPAKTQVIINVWAIGRDPRIWEDPDTFYPERFENNPIDFRGSDFELLPFDAGRRICPGISFGMASVEIGLANLLCHFDWKLGNESEQVDMSEAFGSAVRRKTDLWLVPLPRKNL